MPTMLEKGTAERKDGWKAEGKAEAVLAVLRRNFKNVPEHIEQVVLAMTDPIALESVLMHAIDSKTLDEFATVL